MPAVCHRILSIIDVHLPGMSGYDLCRELKSREATCQIPVIFFSPSEEVVDRVLGFSAGGSDHVTWPFQTSDLLARISAHLALRSQQIQLESKSAVVKKENTPSGEIKHHSHESSAEMIAEDGSLSLVPLENPSAAGDPIENLIERDALLAQLREQVELTRRDFGYNS